MDQMGWAFLKMLIALPVVLFLVVLLLRHGPGFGRRGNPNRTMQVLDRLYLSKNSGLYVVRVQDFFYLLGQQNGGLVLLDKLDHYPLIREKEEAPGTFAALLAENMEKIYRQVGKGFRSGKGERSGDE